MLLIKYYPVRTRLALLYFYACICNRLNEPIVYQPVIHKLAIMWHKGEKEAFGKIILQQMGIILVLTLAAMTGGYLLGIPVLSLIYGVNLKGYRTDLLVLLAGGGMLAFVIFFI